MDEGGSRKRKIVYSSPLPDYDSSRESSPSPDAGGPSAKRHCLPADTSSDRPPELPAEMSLPQLKAHMPGAALKLSDGVEWESLSSVERLDAETDCQMLLVRARHGDPTLANILYGSLHRFLRILGLHYTANEADAALVAADHSDIFRLHHSFQEELIAPKLESSRSLARLRAPV